MEPFRSKYRSLPWVVEEHSRILLPSDPSLVQRVAIYLGEHAVIIGSCPIEREVQVTTALAEALNNAILHGNMEISSELREGEGDAFHRLMQERRVGAPFKDRQVEVNVHVTDEAISWTIRDEGPGFDWKTVPDPTDGDNVLRSWGRGILIMRSFADDVQFNDKGNEVTLTVARPREPTDN